MRYAQDTLRAALPGGQPQSWSNLHRDQRQRIVALALGTPSAKYAKADGVYQRPYTAGKVLVNPTGSTYKVSLGATYVDLAGTRVTAVTLGPNSGKVLRKA